MNLYSYVFNDPVNLVDPLGLFGKGHFGRTGQLGKTVRAGYETAIASVAAGGAAYAAGAPTVSAALIDAGIATAVGFTAFAATDIVSGAIAEATGFDPQTAIGDALADLLLGDGEEHGDDATSCEGQPATEGAEPQ